MRAAVLIALLGAAALRIAEADVQVPAERKPTYVAPQSLSSALQVLAKERDFQIIYRSEVTDSVRSRGATGDLTAEEEFEQLLAGTGLTYRYLATRAITIGLSEPSTAADGRKVTAPPPSARSINSPRNVHPEAEREASDDHTLSQVTVSTQREALKNRLRSFVSSVTHAPVAASDDPLQRWKQPICFLVAGLPHPKGESVLQRISEAAESAGAPLADENHCQPNFYVVATTRPQELLRLWQHHDHTMYNYAGPLPVKSFFDSARPIRVWYNVELDDTQGAPVSTSEVHTVRTADGMRSGVGGYASHLEYNVVRNFQSVIVVVDLSKVAGIDWSAIADYVAMEGLTRVNPDADFGNAATILQLFKARGDEAAPQSLGTWDKSFLKALYTTRQEVKGQRTEIMGQMLHDVAP